jgi:hypothetical protein
MLPRIGTVFMFLGLILVLASSDAAEAQQQKLDLFPKTEIREKTAGERLQESRPPADVPKTNPIPSGVPVSKDVTVSPTFQPLGVQVEIKTK